MLETFNFTSTVHFRLVLRESFWWVSQITFKWAAVTRLSDYSKYWNVSMSHKWIIISHNRVTVSLNRQRVRIKCQLLLILGSRFKRRQPLPSPFRTGALEETGARKDQGMWSSDQPYLEINVTQCLGWGASSCSVAYKLRD